MHPHFEQTYPANSLVLWDALTKVEQMQQWYFPQLKKFQAKINFTTSFKVYLNNRTFTHVWRVISVVPYSHLKYQWSYIEYPGKATVEFGLHEIGPYSLLKMDYKVMQAFPSNILEFTEESGKVGWSYLLNTRLREYLK